MAKTRLSELKVEKIQKAIDSVPKQHLYHVAKSRIPLNLFEITNQVYKYLETKLNSGSLITGEEKTLANIISGTHRNNAWVKKNIHLFLRILIEGKLIKCFPGEKYIKK